MESNGILDHIKVSAEERTLRLTEFSHLNNICYVDYTGAGVYSQSQIDLIAEQMKNSIFSHPHGSSVISQFCVAEIDQIRTKVLKHFDTDSDDYSVIFTSGTTAAIKLVADYFDFNGGAFVYLKDIHTSVLGMREVVKTNDIHGVAHNDAFVMLKETTEDQTEQSLSESNSLFVYSAQCNFSGFKYPLQWCNQVKEYALQKYYPPHNANWFVLLDAATYSSHSHLSLKKYQPDFVSISFYKMFGYPTGLGALLVKNSSVSILNKTYYGGGTVKIAMSNQNFHVKKDSVSGRFEDGTINYLSIISLKHGFDTKRRICRTLNNSNTFQYSQYTYMFLKHLHYPNNGPAVELYADTDYSNEESQGCIVNFNLLRKDGTYYGYYEVQNLANLKKIQLRTGCHCNPGACQRHLQMSDDMLKYNFQQGHVCGDDKDIINGRPTGSVRISYGYASNWDDVFRILSFIKLYFAQKAILSSLFYDFTQKLKIRNENPIEDKLSLDSINNTAEENFRECKTLKNKVVHEMTPPLSPQNQERSYIGDTTDSTSGHILERIFLYPVKSCGFYQVKDRWEIDSSGLKFDRQWMIVNPSGVALTQKLEPKLCLIQPDIDLDTKVLTLYFKGCLSSVKVSLDINEEIKEDTLDLCKTKVCNDKIVGYDCGDHVAKWLDKNLNHTGLRLIRLKQRTSKQNLNSFSNMGQYLLITWPSIRESIKKLETNFNTEFNLDSFTHRFRSNFVISGNIEPNEEFSWNKITIQSKSHLLDFSVKSPCVRCQYIYIDQETSEVTDVPLGITKFGIYINNDFHGEENQKIIISVDSRVFVYKKEISS